MNGITVQAGFSAGSAWGQTFQTVTTKVPIISESMSLNYDLNRSEALDGSAAQKAASNGRVNHPGAINLEVDYGVMDILEYCMGAASGGIYSFTASLEKFFHFEVDKYTRRHRSQSVMVNSFTLSGEAGSGKPLQLSMDCVGYDGEPVVTDFPSLSALPTTRAFFEHMTNMWIGDLDNSLTTGDAIEVRSFELSCNHNQQVDGKDSSDQSHNLQPIRDGFRTAELKLSFARYTSACANLHTWKSDNEHLQVYMQFTSGSNNMIVQIPEAVITAGGEFPISGAGALEGDVTLELYANNNNSNMATVEDQFEITIV